MPTVSKAIADRVVASNGDLYPGEDPICTKIVEYDNAFGGVGYGLVYTDMDQDNYRASHFVRNPRVYWKRK
jgi:hypothetical protein